MRKFSSYGTIDSELHFYVPRQALIDKSYAQLMGEHPENEGHYITVWGSRQSGRKWVMRQIFSRLQADERFDVVNISLESLKAEHHVNAAIKTVAGEITGRLDKECPIISTVEEFQHLFKNDVLDKPLILMLERFDALPQAVRDSFINVFSNIYFSRINDSHERSKEKEYLLHAVILGGVRNVGKIEHTGNSPFNPDQGIDIPNFTFDEVNEMFKWYEQESGQKIEPEVIENLYNETRGQPGLTCWFGELLTEGFESYSIEKDKPITLNIFKDVYNAAIRVLPNSHILNIISKVEDDPYKNRVMELFRTDEKMIFSYDDELVSYLYVNGIIDKETSSDASDYVRFSCPFVQKRLFNYFSNELFAYVGMLYDTFEDLSDTIGDKSLDIRNLIRRYQTYLKKNREWLMKDAPRRETDLYIHEAVFHFNLYMYLHEFLKSYGGKVHAEFPDGNAKTDIIINYQRQVYGIEIKAYTHKEAYQQALKQAVLYGKQMDFKKMAVVFLTGCIDDECRTQYEADYQDEITETTVMPIFVDTE